MRLRVLSPLVLAIACSGRAASGPTLSASTGAGEPVAPPPIGPAAPPSSGVAPGEEATLLLDGTPPIPDELRQRLEQYLETRSASIMDLADDGKSMLIGTRFGDTAQIHRVAMPGGARTQLTFSREPSGSAWPA